MRALDLFWSWKRRWHEVAAATSCMSCVKKGILITGFELALSSGGGAVSHWQDCVLSVIHRLESGFAAYQLSLHCSGRSAPAADADR